jgi:kynurenine formamidase
MKGALPAGRNRSKDSPIHKIMLARNVVIVEYGSSLRQLAQLEVELFVLRLSRIGADGSSCRAMAMEL